MAAYLQPVLSHPVSCSPTPHPNSQQRLSHEDRRNGFSWGKIGRNKSTGTRLATPQGCPKLNQWQGPSCSGQVSGLQNPSITFAPAQFYDESLILIQIFSLSIFSFSTYAFTAPPPPFFLFYICASSWNLLAVHSHNSDSFLFWQ